MKPDRYEVSSDGRRRLSGFIQKRGSRMGFPAWGGFLFGIPFVTADVLIVLVGTKVVPVDPASVHAPYWVLTVAGVSFALGGLMVWGMAWRQFAGDRQRRQAARQYPNEPALADYHWHPGGFEVSGWDGAAKALGLAVGLTVFFSIFNWWAFWGDGGWIVKAVVVPFDCLGLAVWWQAGRQIGSALKFGHSRIAFTRFPYRLLEPVVIRWQPSAGISQVNKGTSTLRCVEEWTEARGSGKTRSVSVAHEEIWSARTGQDYDPRYVEYFERFNRQRFFEAHEVLEALWLPQRQGPNGPFYKGLIQLAGAFVHWQKNRLGPATALLGLARANLRKYPAIHGRLNVAGALAMVEEWLRWLKAAGAAGQPLAQTSPPQLRLELSAHTKDRRCGAD
jgi:hypothetical protein